MPLLYLLEDERSTVRHGGMRMYVLGGGRRGKKRGEKQRVGSYEKLLFDGERGIEREI